MYLRSKLPKKISQGGTFPTKRSAQKIIKIINVWAVLNIPPWQPAFVFKSLRRVAVILQLTTQLFGGHIC